MADVLEAADANPPPPVGGTEDIDRFVLLPFEEYKRANERLFELEMMALKDVEDLNWWAYAGYDLKYAIDCWQALNEWKQFHRGPAEEKYRREFKWLLGEERFRRGEMPTFYPYARRLYAPWRR